MCKGGARRPRAVRETGRSRRSPEGVEGRGQREALRSPGIPGQRSAGRYEDSNETGSVARALCERRRPEGLEWRAHGAKHSAQPRNTAQAKRSAVRTQRGDHVELRTVSRRSRDGGIVQTTAQEHLLFFTDSQISAAARAHWATSRSAPARGRTARYAGGGNRARSGCNGAACARFHPIRCPGGNRPAWRSPPD